MSYDSTPLASDDRLDLGKHASLDRHLLEDARSAAKI